MARFAATDQRSQPQQCADVWPDQAERLARIAAAIDVACAHPPEIAGGDGAAWLEAKLAEP